MNTLIIFFFIGCRNDNSSTRSTKNNTLKNQPEVESKSITSDNEIQKCNCDTNTVFDHLRANLSLVYYNSSLSKGSKDSLRFYTSTDSLINSVRSLRINTLKIPKELFVFKNIEQISFIGQQRGDNDTLLKGLKSFSKLVSINLWGVNLSFKDIETEVSNLTRMRVEKSKVTNFNEIRNLSELNSIYMFHSGLDSLPKNWKNLSCLKKININSHSWGQLDLSEINLHQLNCIEEIEFTTIIDQITGIPEGTDEKSLKKIKIRHPKLTSEEKEMIKASR